MQPLHPSHPCYVVLQTLQIHTAWYGIAISFSLQSLLGSMTGATLYHMFLSDQLPTVCMGPPAPHQQLDVLQYCCMHGTTHSTPTAQRPAVLLYALDPPTPHQQLNILQYCCMHWTHPLHTNSSTSCSTAVCVGPTHSTPTAQRPAVLLYALDPPTHSTPTAQRPAVLLYA